MKKAKPIAERFWIKAVKVGQCWEWRAARNRGGYGLFAFRTNPTHYKLAHRVAYMLECGPIPDGLVVMHKCDNRACVKPTHLSVGTYGDNNRDAASKGRYPLGTRHTMAKLNPEKVKIIRVRLTQGDSFGSIGRDMRVSAATISALAKGRTWRHVS